MGRPRRDRLLTYGNEEAFSPACPEPFAEIARETDVRPRRVLSQAAARASEARASQASCTISVSSCSVSSLIRLARTSSLGVLAFGRR